MSLLAWKANDAAYDSGAVVFAESRGQAKRQAMAELELEFTDVRVRRAPVFDDLAPGPIDDWNYISRGWSTYCACGEEMGPDQHFRTPSGLVYCTEKCARFYRGAMEKWEPALPAPPEKGDDDAG